MTSPLVIPVPGLAELHLTTRSGHVTITAEERPDVVIETGAPSRGAEVDATGRVSLTSAKGGSASLEVRCPAGTDIVAGTISGSVELHGPLGEVRVTTVSGSVRIEQAERADVRSISGNIELGRCTEACLLRTKSGQAVCGSSRDARASTVSGRIVLGDTSGSVRAQSVSGTVEVGTKRDGDVAVQTVSGSVKVEVPPGVRPDARLRSMTGRPRCECEEGSDCRVAVQSVSGKIEVVCA